MTEAIRDALQRAKDDLLTHGWTQGAYRTGCGECISEAFRRVLGVDTYFSQYQTIARALGVANISQWNDAPGRTPEQVLDLFDRAIGPPVSMPAVVFDPAVGIAIRFVRQWDRER